jgi:HAD superfamily hydrolase (TIGR01490 family)
MNLAAAAATPEARVAAFFDLDGTLISCPSLERRMFRALLYRRAIPARNFVLWMAEALRLLPRGLVFARLANKMYLRGISAEVANAAAVQVAGGAHLRFFPEALERIDWHVGRGHAIVLVTGTLQSLARTAAASLEAELARRSAATNIVVLATGLEEMTGRWTGRLIEEPMFGPAKALAIHSIAARKSFDLSDCYAYGDSVHDRQMLECVRHAVVVNGSPELRRIARREGWRAVEWQGTNTNAALAGRRARPLTEKKAETLG